MPQQRRRGVTVDPQSLLALLALRGARIMFTAHAHDVPRELFDAVGVPERAYETGSRAWWSKVVDAGGMQVTIYTDEPPRDELDEAEQQR